MADLTPIIKNYSVKYDQKIKKICEPLVDILKIPVFTYSFVEADGRFGYLTNKLDFSAYYFEANLHLQNPYFAHPALFRSGYAMLPCSLEEETQRILSKRFQANHFFLSLNTSPHLMEAFIFANVDETLNENQYYLSRLDLLNKFCRYFKREAIDLIGKIRADHFDIKAERENKFLDASSTVPLTAYHTEIQKFLKKVTGLTRQERTCLDYFKH